MRLGAAISLVFLLAAAPSVLGQAEKVLERSKQLKKKVEGGQTTSTNKPPPKAPPAPAKKPSR